MAALRININVFMKQPTTCIKCLFVCILLISNLAHAVFFDSQRGVCYRISDTATRQEEGAGFVWKPISEGNGNLVVLFPASSASTGGTLYFSGQTVSGSFVGRTNGDRPTVRWPAPGGAYPDGLDVCDGDTGGTTPPAPEPEPTPESNSIIPVISILLDF